MEILPVLNQSKFDKIIDAERTARVLISQEQNGQAAQLLSGALQLVQQELLATLYLNRAVAYHHLKQHDLALADAKSVIQHHPSSPFGYLQAADTYFAAKDYRAAFLTIWNGIKTVAGDHHAYSLLINKRKWIEHEINTMNCRQLSRLPQDLYREIFLSLSSQERFNCLYLCKGWNNILGSASGLWQNVAVFFLSGRKLESFICFLDNANVQHIHFTHTNFTNLPFIQVLNRLRTICK